MKTRFKHLVFWALLCLPASTMMANSWAYMGYYPWIYTFEEGWLYHSPVQKVYLDGEWVLNPFGDAYDINRLFEAPLTTFAGSNGSEFIFRLTISSEFPDLGLLAVGDLPNSRDEPIVNEVDENARSALDPSALTDLPAPDQEGRFDAYYLVRLHKTHNTVLAQAHIYFNAPEPFLSWAGREQIHGMIRFNFNAIDNGAFVIVGALDGAAGIDAYRGNFKAAVHDLPPPPPEIDPAVFLLR